MDAQVHLSGKANQDLALRLSYRLRNGPDADSAYNSHSCGVTCASYIFGFRGSLWIPRENAWRHWRDGSALSDLVADRGSIVKRIFPSSVTAKLRTKPQSRHNGLA